MPTEEYTADDSFTVPSGVQVVEIETHGENGEGGSVNSANETSTSGGGSGAKATGDLSVSGGDILYIRFPNGGVGADSGGAVGGFGGHGADVRQNSTSTSSIVISSGGGGGGGAARATHNETGNVSADSGGGGTANGGNGGDASTESGSGSVSGSGGSGASQSGITGADGSGDSDSGSAFDAGAAGGGGGGGAAGGGGGTGNCEGSTADFSFDTFCVSAAAGGGAGGGTTSGVSNATTTNGGSEYSGGRVILTYSLPAPGAPVNTEQTVTGTNTAEASWDEDTSGGTPDHYELEVNEDGGGWTLVDGNVTSTSYTYTITAGVDTVRFRVRAENSGGTSNWSYTTTKSTEITSVTPSNTDDTSFDLSWDAADDATEYDVLLAESSGSSEGDYSIDQTVSGTTATVSGLENGERYFARPIARYPNTDSLGPEKTTTTTVPSPTLDSLDTTVKREVTVNYTLNDNSTDGDVLVELSPDGGSTWPESVTVSGLSQTSMTFTGLLDGEEYTARVTRNTDHASAQSGTASAQTILPAPLDLTHPTEGETTSEYDWSPQHNNGNTRVEYKRGDGAEWETYSTLGNDATAETVDGLLNGEEYDSRVVAETDDAETTDYDPDVKPGEPWTFQKPLTVEDSEFDKPLENSGTVQPTDT